MANVPRSSYSYNSRPEMPQDPPVGRDDDHKKRSNRRQYALPKFEFEDDTAQAPNMLATYGLTEDGKIGKSADLQKRVERYYGDQVLVPNGSVSPCINATDRARRARRNRIRDPGTPPSPETFCDITPLLQDAPKPKSVAQVRDDDDWADDEVIDESEIHDMVLSEDDNDPGKEFEVVESEPMSEHNGTVRRWYKGFRH